MPSKKRFFGGLVGANPLRSGSFQDPGAVDRASSNEGVLSIDTAGPESSTTTITTLGDYSTKSETQFTATSATSGDQFGHSAAMSGDGTIVVFGAIGQDTTATDSGAAYVYENGTQVAILKASDAGASDNFGTDVAISKDGSVIVVGAPLWDATGASDAGAVYVYVKPSGGWTTTSSEDAKLTRSSPYSLTYLGSGVAISDDGNTIVASAYMDPTDLGLGGAYVYQKPGSGWTSATETAALTGSDVTESDRLGHGLAISGDGTVIALGAPYADEPDSNCGVVYVYDRSGSTWSSTTETHKVGRISTSGNHYLGWSCALNEDGTILVAGAPGVNSSQGFLFVFEDSGGTWSESKILVLNPGSATNQELGDDVAISRDGSLIIAGVPGYSGVVTSGGALAVWEAPATGGWANRSSTAHDYIITDSNTSSSDNLGGRHIDYEYLPHTIALSNDGRKALAGVRSAGTAGDGILFTATGGNPGTTTTTTTQTTQWFWGGLRGRDAIVAGSGVVGDDKSLRFDGSNDYLSWSSPSASNRTTNTISLWFKTHVTNVSHALFQQRTTGTLSDPQFLVQLRLVSGENRLRILDQNSGNQIILDSNSDLTFSANTWYHLVVSVDTTEDNDPDKVKVWVNGQQYTNWSSPTWPSTNYQTGLNRSGTRMLLGVKRQNGSTSLDDHTNAQLAEYHFIDGTAYDASYFGETRDGVWVPKEVTGLTYGNNGFYLDFAGNDTGVVLKLNADNSLTDETGRHTPIGAGVSYSTDTPFATGSSHSFSFSPTATSDVSEVITLPNSTDFQFGSDPFTIEMWFKWDGTTGLQVLFNTYEGTGVGGLAVAINGATLAIYSTSIYSTGWDMASAASGGISFTADTWHHLAIVRDSNGYIEAFKDGVKGTSSISTSPHPIYTNGTDDAHVGGTSNYYAFNGLIDDVRITKGIARDIAAEWTNGVYTSALTNAPEYLGDFGVDRTTDGTGVTLLLDGENATIADVSSASTAVSYSASHISQNTSVYKHGSGSIEFIRSNGVNNVITYTGPTLSSDFTVEFWWRPDQLLSTSSNDDNIIWDSRNASNGNFPVLVYSGTGPANFPRIAAFIDGLERITSSQITTAQQWYHVAFVRSGGTYTLYLDGVSQGTYGSSTGVSSTHYIGRRFAAFNSSYYGTDGYLDDFRLTAGVARDIAADWTAGVYTSALTNDDTWDKPKNNFSVEGNITADDQLLDTPNLRFATLDPANSNAGITYAEGNLRCSASISGSLRTARHSTAIPDNGKVYVEVMGGVEPSTVRYLGSIGFTSSIPSAGAILGDANGWDAFTFGNALYVRHDSVSSTSSNTAFNNANYANNVYMLALDRANNAFYFGVNGQWVESLSSGTLVSSFSSAGNLRTQLSTVSNIPSTGSLYMASAVYKDAGSNYSIHLNHGQDHTFSGLKPALLTPYSDTNGAGEFYYEPPSGFLALADNYVVTDSLATTGVLSVSEMLQASL